MALGLRSLARWLLGVERTPTYYLPWLTRPGLECALLLSNVEARFKAGYNHGPFPVTVVQYDADGTAAHRYQVALADSTDAAELPLQPAPGNCGFVTVSGERIDSDLYVTLSDGSMYTATHGRGEFVERYPLPTRLVMDAVSGGLALLGRALPLFVRDQYAYLWPDSCSHLLLMNLSNVTNRIRVTAGRDGRRIAARLVRLAPMGAHVLDISSLDPGESSSQCLCRLRLEGNAWFNLYVVGAGSRGLAGPLSLMHVK
jgi:hypothetical protein